MAIKKKATAKTAATTPPRRPLSIAEIRQACSAHREVAPLSNDAQADMIAQTRQHVRGSRSIRAQTEFTNTVTNLRTLARFLDWYMKRSGAYAA